MSVCVDIAMALGTEDLGHVLLRGSESLIPSGFFVVVENGSTEESQAEVLDVQKHLSANICSEELLIPEVLRLNITEDDMEREHRFEFNFPFQINFVYL